MGIIKSQINIFFSSMKFFLFLIISNDKTTGQFLFKFFYDYNHFLLINHLEINLGLFSISMKLSAIFNNYVMMIIRKLLQYTLVIFSCLPSFLIVFKNEHKKVLWSLLKKNSRKV